MQRRRFLKGAVAGSVVVAGGTVIWYAAKDAHAPDIAAALSKLEAFTGQNLQSTGTWNAAQIFNHVAQSVEYSLSGYPEHKSDVFKASVGSLAFSLFSSHGGMHHKLDEAIPGAPQLLVHADPEQALLRLRRALAAFQNYRGELADHFAYGPLSKSDYALAHIMHLDNHLEEIVAV